MKSIVLPYGDAGWQEKMRRLEELLSSRRSAPLLYDDVLIVVSSARMKRVYGRLLLEYAGRRGGAALVPPDVRTLHHLFQNLSAGLDGPRLIDENSRLILLEGTVKECLGTASPFPLDTSLIAPSLSSALAGMIEQLSGAGAGPADLTAVLRGSGMEDKPQVRLLVDVYTRYQNTLRENNLADPAMMLAYLRDHVDPAWFDRYRAIVIDGIRDIGPLEAAVLTTMAGHADCSVFVDAPSADLLKNAGDKHPLKIVSDVLARLRLFPDSGAAAADEDQRFLSRALFSDRPFAEIAGAAPDPSAFSRTIDLLSAVNMREEVSLIAGKVKQSLRSGTPADAILVAFPALDEYGPLAEELFTDYGIPYNRALGRQLGTSAVAIALVSLLRSCQEDFSSASLLRVFGSPFLKFGRHPQLAPTLDRFMRNAGITGGRQQLLRALKFHPDGMLADQLGDLFGALDPFSSQDALPLGAWAKRLDTLLAWSGLGERVAAIHGPLNINLQAYRKLIETMGSLARAGELFPRYSSTFDEWLFLLKKTFLHTRFQVPPDDEGGVQILGLEESLGMPWKEIYLGGLVDGAFPRRMPQNIFLPEAVLERLGVGTLERTRLNAAHHFYRLLLSADSVTLTWPESEGDRPLIPSSFLDELTPLKAAGLINRDAGKTSGIQFSLNIEDSRSIPELAKAISAAGQVDGIDALLHAEIEGLAGIRSALSQNPAQAAPAAPPLIKREFWVTELDAYLNCPYDYFVSRILGLEPLEEVTEDLSASDRGSKVHGILKNFYETFGRTAVTRENRDEAMAVLRRLADQSFGREADTFRNRREKGLFLSVMAERFLDAEIGFWKQGMKPAYLEQKIERIPLMLSTGQEIELSGKIDRIDADENGNFIVVDYKTGKYPLPKKGIDQDIFQLPVYAVMARQALSGKDPALTRPIGLAYYDLAGKSGAGARDVVLFDKDVLSGHPSSTPQSSPKSTQDFESILAQSMDKARRAIEHILARDFPAAPGEENRCRYCRNEEMCKEER